MAGLAAISLQQRTGIDGRPFPGARAQFLEAETLNPIPVWQDYGLGTPLPNPVEADDYGVFPAIFIDEEIGFYRIRVTTATGVILTDLTTLPVIGPAGGGGGAETPVDPNAVIQTGEIIHSLKSGSRAGCVRLNGRTIGSAISGATERANSDCEALFSWYWTNHSNDMAPVIGGRGASAVADWAANKQITLFNAQNKAFFGLDGMGAVSAGGFAGVTFTEGDATTPGSIGGAALHTLVTAEIPSHNHTITDPGHKHGVKTRGDYNAGTGSTAVMNGVTGGPFPETEKATTGITGTNATGGGGAHNNMSPFILGTIYQKL